MFGVATAKQLLGTFSPHTNPFNYHATLPTTRPAVIQTNDQAEREEATSRMAIGAEWLCRPLGTLYLGKDSDESVPLHRQ